MAIGILKEDTINGTEATGLGLRMGAHVGLRLIMMADNTSQAIGTEIEAAWITTTTGITTGTGTATAIAIMIATIMTTTTATNA